MRARLTTANAASMAAVTPAAAAAAAAVAAAAARTAAGRRGAGHQQQQRCMYRVTGLVSAPTAAATLIKRRADVAAKAAAAAGPFSDGGDPSQPPMTPEERAAVRASVDAAAATINEIIEEVSRDVFVSEAAAYVSGAPADVALPDAIRGAVAARLEWLDANFLGALGGYIEVARARRDPALLEVLTLLRSEVLEQVARRLPPPVRALNAALAQASARARVGVLRTALAGGGGDVPACDMEALAAAAGQLVDDMEDQDEVADRALLARLVLVREELRALHWRAARGVALGGKGGKGDDSLAFTGGGGNTAAAADAGEGRPQQRDSVEALAADAAAAAADAAADDGGFFSFHRGNLPRRCAAFAQALLAVAEPPRRVALLRKAFAEDWDGMAGASGPAGAASVPTGSSSGGGVVSGDAVAEAPDVVRPGRLLSTVHAMRRELALQHSGGGGGEGRSGEGGGSGTDGNNVDAVLERLARISVEATLVLDEMSRAAAGDAGKRKG